MVECNDSWHNMVQFYLRHNNRDGCPPDVLKHLFRCNDCYRWSETYYGENAAHLLFPESVRDLVHALDDKGVEVSGEDVLILHKRSHLIVENPDDIEKTIPGYNALIRRIKEANIPVSE